MADDKKLIEFQHEARGAVFEAALESDAHPEPSYFQWVTGLPEALRTPGAWFATTKKTPGLLILTVGQSVKTDLGKDAQRLGVAETTLRSEIPLAGKKP